MVTSKKVVNFFDQKVHPRRNPGYAYDFSTITQSATGWDFESNRWQSEVSA